MGSTTVDGDVFRAVADPTRRRLVDRLAEGSATVSTLVEHVDGSQSAVSQHLAVLRAVGLVHAQRSGRRRIYHLDPEPLMEIRRWVARYEQFWDIRLERLGDLLDDPDHRPDDPDHRPDDPEQEQP